MGGGRLVFDSFCNERFGDRCWRCLILFSGLVDGTGSWSLFFYLGRCGGVFHRALRGGRPLDRDFLVLSVLVCAFRGNRGRFQLGFLVRAGRVPYLPVYFRTSQLLR